MSKKNIIILVSSFILAVILIPSITVYLQEKKEKEKDLREYEIRKEIDKNWAIRDLEIKVTNVEGSYPTKIKITTINNTYETIRGHFTINLIDATGSVFEKKQIQPPYGISGTDEWEERVNGKFTKYTIDKSSLK